MRGDEMDLDKPLETPAIIDKLLKTAVILLICLPMSTLLFGIGIRNLNNFDSTGIIIGSLIFLAGIVTLYNLWKPYPTYPTHHGVAS